MERTVSIRTAAQAARISGIPYDRVMRAVVRRSPGVFVFDADSPIFRQIEPHLEEGAASAESRRERFSREPLPFGDGMLPADPRDAARPEDEDCCDRPRK